MTTEIKPTKLRSIQDRVSDKIRQWKMNAGAMYVMCEGEAEDAARETFYKEAKAEWEAEQALTAKQFHYSYNGVMLKDVKRAISNSPFTKGESVIVGMIIDGGGLVKVHVIDSKRGRNYVIPFSEIKEYVKLTGVNTEFTAFQVIDKSNYIHNKRVR